MPRIIYNNEARNDPEKLQEVQDDLLEAMTIGEEMVGLVDQLAVLTTRLQPDMVPGLEEVFRRIGLEVHTLQQDVTRTFSHMPEGAVNMTYLGNLAARRYGVEAPSED